MIEPLFSRMNESGHAVNLLKYGNTDLAVPLLDFAVCVYMNM